MKADAVLVRDGTRRLVAMGLSEAFLLGCGFILQCLLARCLDPDNYGILAALNVAVLFPLLLAAGGMPRAARNLVGSNSGNFGPACRQLARRHLPACAALAALAGIPGWLIASRRPGGIVLGVAALILSEGLVRCAVLEPCLNLMNGLQRHDLHAQLIAAHAALRLALVGSAAWVTRGLVGTAAGGVAAAAVAAAAAYAILSTIQAPSGAPDPDFDARSLAWTRQAPVFELLNYLPLAANLWLVELLAPEGGGSGPYAACFVLAQSALGLGRASVAANSSMLAREIARGRPDLARSHVVQTLRGSILAVIPILAVAIASGESLVAWIFGPAYAGGGRVLAPLLGGVVGAGFSLFLGEAVGIAGGLALRRTLMAAVGVASLAVDGLAFGLGGTAGAALALALYGLAASTAMALAARRALGPLFPLASLLRAICGSVPLGILSGVSGELGPFLALTALGAVLYMGSLACLGEFAPAEPGPPPT